MGDSSPDLQIEDEAAGSEPLEPTESDSTAFLSEWDDQSEISSVIRAVGDVGRAEWTLTRTEDEEAPDVICSFRESDDAFDEVLGRESRAVGHGLRPVPESELVPVTSDPSIVVTDIE